jgi:hypothetical protein
VRKLWFDVCATWIAIPLKMDNQSALVLIKNPAAGARNPSKHTDVCYNFSRHRVICGEIYVSFVKTRHDCGCVDQATAWSCISDASREFRCHACMWVLECSLKGSVEVGLC